MMHLGWPAVDVISLHTYFVTIDLCTSTRHLRSWSNTVIEYGNGETESEIDRDEIWLSRMDNGAEDRYLEDCLTKEGFVEGDVDYEDEYWSRRMERTQNEANDGGGKAFRVSSSDSLSDRDYESIESSLSFGDRSSVASQTSDNDDSNESRLGSEDEWIPGRDLPEEANNGALEYLDPVFRRRVSVQRGYKND